MAKVHVTLTGLRLAVRVDLEVRSFLEGPLRFALQEACRSPHGDLARRHEARTILSSRTGLDAEHLDEVDGGRR